MRDPEAEEDDVVAAVRCPRQEVGLDEAHAVFPEACFRAGEHFRGRVYGGDARRVLEQALRTRLRMRRSDTGPGCEQVSDTATERQ